MMLGWLFPCTHPIGYLSVEKQETVEIAKDYPEYEEVTYHLRCHKCTKVFDTVGYARLNAVAKARENARQAEYRLKMAESDRKAVEFYREREAAAKERMPQ